jgi:hypothetical protein
MAVRRRELPGLYNFEQYGFDPRELELITDAAPLDPPDTINCNAKGSTFDNPAYRY